jgi:hypothetical protein
MRNDYENALIALIARKLELLNPGSSQNEGALKEITSAVALMKKEVHRNTRHAAVDKMGEVRERWQMTHDFPAAERMLDEMVGATFNLKME